MTVKRYLLRGRRLRRAPLTLLLVTVGALTFGAVSARPDAADPVVPATTGAVVTNADGSRTVTVRGQWQWPTHRSDCNGDKRAVGFAVDWNDPGQPGNVVTTLNGATIDVGTAAANAYNAADNLVHATPPAAESANPSAWRGGCGTFNAAAGYNSGAWGPLSHTYAPSFSGPITICALMYDVHLSVNGGTPHDASEITAGGSKHNDDNSAEKNKNTPLGNGCFQTTINAPPNTPTPSTPSTPTPTSPAAPLTPPATPASPATPTPTPKPSIGIVKTQRVGPSGAFVTTRVTATVGQTVYYAIVVTNTGSEQVFVSLNDPGCDGGSLQAHGATAIAAGGTVTFTCSHLVTAGDGATIPNVATAAARSASGAPVKPVSSRVVANARPPAKVLAAQKTVKQQKPAAPAAPKAVKKTAKPARAVVKRASFTG
jgi:hypothetical protein